VIQAVYGISTDGLDLWPDNKAIDGFDLKNSVLVDQRSATGQQMPASIQQRRLKFTWKEVDSANVAEHV
jgi:hypothetical protein